MSLARLVMTAVTVEGRAKSAVARDYGIPRFWVQSLVKRFHAEGEAAFEAPVEAAASENAGTVGRCKAVGGSPGSSQLSPGGARPR
jgi:hypothetical protein